MPKPAVKRSFYDVLTDAIADLAAHGYDSAERLESWRGRLRRAAVESMTPAHVLEETVRRLLRGEYERMVDRGGILKLNPGVSRFTLDRIRPRLRAELDRRILAAADLIRLNRAQAIETTLRRFSGWATSIPAGGTALPGRGKAKDDVRKSLASLPFTERRVAIDQGHKLRSSLSDIVATDAGAIAAVWHSHWRQANYDYRPDHKERDGEIYAVRGCWALEHGLMKVGPAGYTDTITRPGEEVFCRCWYTYLYGLGQLPAAMVTEKGRMALAEAREKVAAMHAA